MKDEQKGMIKYTYNSGAIKSFKLVKRHIHEVHDIDRLEQIISALIKDLDKEMKDFEKVQEFTRP